MLIVLLDWPEYQKKRGIALTGMSDLANFKTMQYKFGKRRTHVYITWLITGFMLAGCLLKYAPSANFALAYPGERIQKVDFEVEPGDEVKNELPRLDFACAILTCDVSSARNRGRVQCLYFFEACQTQLRNHNVRGPPRS
jgi:hypothetical protein